MTAEAQPGDTQGQDPQAGAQGTQAVPTPEPQAPTPQPQSDSPWASDLNEFFEDPEVRTRADEFVRTKVQPYVTRLEQSQAPEGAVDLFTDFQEAPQETFLAVAAELYGDDALPYFEAILDELGGGDPQAQQGEPPAQPQGQQLSPEAQEAIDYVNAEREDQEYTADVSDLVAANKGAFPEDDVEKAKQLISPFVYTADGDLDQAFEQYRQWASEIGAGNVSPADAAAASEQGITPDAIPSVLGDGANPAVPANKQYGGDIGSAIDDFLAEERAKKAPPPVGGV